MRKWLIRLLYEICGLFDSFIVIIQNRRASQEIYITWLDR